MSRPIALAASAVALLGAAVDPAAASPGSAILARYVVLGEDGVAQARVITADAACPAIRVDGRSAPMNVRAAAATLAQRPTASAAALSKPSEFPVTVCEASLPRGVRAASVLGRALPLPKAEARRILVIGDTGCRLKAADKAYQACNDPDAYPFGRIARSAAAWKPDLIVHVGDYEYRETPCPANQAGCAASPWGYGWDAWDADFFIPGAPLLAVAPLVLARGNHEDCARAGQGWFRLLDPRPLAAGRDCNDPTRDLETDDSAPYAVPLGGGAQIVVMDLSAAPNTALKPGDPRLALYRADFQALKALAGHAATTLMVTHKPILGFGAEAAIAGGKLFGGNPAILSAFALEDPALLPKGVDVLLAGHIHLWEQVSFSSDHPSQFITGFSGTQEDVVPLPERLPADARPAPGAIPDAFSSWTAGFGYMTLERTGPRAWRALVRDVEGKVVNRCRIQGRHSSCEKARVG